MRQMWHVEHMGEKRNVVLVGKSEGKIPLILPLPSFHL